MRREVADVCVVGSGAGGSVIAWEAAQAGLRTIVLEQGPRVSPGDMTEEEITMIPRLYKDGGMQMSAQMDFFIMQGACVGGSTVLSNMVLLRAPRAVLAAWRELGARVKDAELDAAFGRIETELGAREPSPGNVSRSTRRFVDGARALGLGPKWMTKALGDCAGCGQCNIGCALGTKQSAERTYLAWAERAGARVLPETEVTEVLHRRGTASGVLARAGRAREPLRVDARVVVSSAGAIGSSALLIRSGITRNVGTRLSFNAATAVTADFADPVDGFDGDQMTAYVAGDGYLLEASHNPLMSAALTTPGWGRRHGEQMRRTRHLAYVGSIAPTSPVGRVVKSPWFGHEEVVFHMPKADLDALERGARAAAEILLAAGARTVALPTHVLRTVSSLDELGRVDRLFDSTRQISIGSAHPQGGNPMSDDPGLGAVDSELRVHGFDNLFVCDASVFPTAIGVNPIQTILAIAKVSARGIVARA